MGFARNLVTEDKFLGGQLVLMQPRDGYRAGVDPVFLAASIAAHEGESVLDLGCGAGAAALCLGARVPGLRLVGVERQPEYADLACKNAYDNDIDMDVVEADLADLPAAVKDESFDHVIMNPPYHLRDRSTESNDAGRAAALFEDTPLAVWIDTATRRLKHRGYLTIIQKAERVPEILGGMDERLGSILVKPLLPREGRAAVLVLVQARKGGRGAFRLAAPLILHDGAEHVGDSESYRREVSAILRDGAALPLW
ncbi:methyltransferase [Maritimibacter sp. UBA3975]|mgnify:CR=1 FL=1|uniref:tRNA1(Val) (adenine(37)-N6)-methyltransferase n=1 Tax=Maritimibacter sp. UBA3975 TaxID=1946833 RepID=UPI000C08E10D|nr:methyltransferase [Maritimibacter sp. UBA3975]MAM61823.1 methyltransferase [Maritimibacter sp.]|tara:strand:+ start:15922 stop:16683 length:762 start_codon:yes stop_codon:yes gene_type:complete